MRQGNCWSEGNQVNLFLYYLFGSPDVIVPSILSREDCAWNVFCASSAGGLVVWLSGTSEGVWTPHTCPFSNAAPYNHSGAAALPTKR